MGNDYSNHHVFAGNDAESVRQSVVNAVDGLSVNQTAKEDEASRSVVVGPADRWIFVGDSAGSTEDADPEAFDGLSLQLSQISPTIAIKMSDCAIVHIYLYRAAQLVDKFGNGNFPWYRFTTAQEAEPFKGDITKWTEFLLPTFDSNALRQIWPQQGDANSIVSATARLFGFDSELAEIGYSVFDEQYEIKYDDYLMSYDFSGFTEFHFVSKPSAT